MSRVFVDVAAVRIQSWLGRSRSLAGRRGASAALAAATAPKVVDDLLRAHPGAERNVEAGHVDGVINVEVAEVGMVEAVARACLAHLRARLPALELTAVSGSGVDYLSAYREEIKPKLLAQQVMIDAPAWADFPPVTSCELCRAGAATTEISIDPDKPKERSRSCADCAGRYERGRREVGGAEASLREGLAALADEPATVVYAPTFEQLAGLPVQGGAGDSPGFRLGDTQLVTVYADGNAVGALLDHVAASGTQPVGGKEALAREITEANAASLAEASLEVWAGDRSPYLPITPHIVAGDDLLVSLPAKAGWRFAIEYATRYSAKLEGLAKGWPGAPVPSVSAGVVFAHCTHPFAEVVTLAETLLKSAKDAVRGRSASLAWVDVTADGPRPVRGRPVLALAALSEPAGLAGQLQRLATLEDSQRSTLAALGRAIVTAADPVDRDKAGKAIDRHLERLGLTDTVAPFRDPVANPVGLGLLDALTLVRWYP